MVKKSKAFSKIFKVTPSKGGLLAGADDYDDSEGDLVDELNGSGTAGTFDDEFPIEPKVMRDGSTDDVFADDDHSEQSTSQNSAEDDDDIEPPELNFDAAFDASFSKIGDAVAASSKDNNNIVDSNHSDGKKKGRRITKLFKKEKIQVPTGHCGEIVVDKTKIPTSKVDLEVQNGKLVINNPEGGDANNENSLDRRTSHSMGSAMLKNFTKTIKSKVTRVSTGKNNLDESAMSASNTSVSNIDDGNNDKDAEFNVEEEDLESSNQEDLDSSRQASRASKNRPSGRLRSKSHDGVMDDSAKGGTQRRPRRREGRGVDTTRLKTNSDDGTGGRKKRNKSKEDAPMRRSQTAENDEIPKRRSRTPADSSPVRSNRNRKPADASPMRRAKTTEAPSGRSKKSIGGSSGGDDSPMRRSKTTDALSGRSKKSIGSSIGGSKQSRRRDGGTDPSDASGGMPTMRRMNTDNTMMNRRATSTRHLNAAGEDLDKSASTGRPGLSSRDRLRRATHSQRHLLGNPNKNGEKPMDRKEMLGNLFGGGGSEQNATSTKQESGREKGDHRRRRGSESDIAEVAIAEGNEESGEESGQDFTRSRGIAEETVEEGEDEDDSIDSVEDENCVNQSGTSMSQKDVEKLIRAVAEKAKGARDDDDLENIVMGALKGDPIDLDDLSLGSDMADYEDDIPGNSSMSGSENMGNSSCSVLSKKDIANKTRNYVNMFLKATENGAEGDAEQRRWSNHANSIADKVGEGELGDLSESGGDMSGSSRQRETKATTKKSGKVKASRVSLVDVSARAELVKAAKALDKSSKGNRVSSSTSRKTNIKGARKLDTRMSALALCIAFIAICHPSLGVSAEEQGSLFPAVTVKQPVTEEPTKPTNVTVGEVMLGEPSCSSAVADTLVCDVTYEWEVAHNSSKVDVAIEAIITCPLATATASDTSTPATLLSSIASPQECACLATVSWLGESSGGAAIPDPSECSCEWCAGEDGNIDGMSVNCVGSSANPAALGDCQAIGCDGSCLDGNATDETAVVTRPPKPETDETTTPASTNGTTTTQAPTTMPSVERTLYWIPSAFYVYNDQQKKANDLSEDDQLGLHEAYVAFVQGVMTDIAATEDPPSSNATTPTRRRRNLLRRGRRRLAPALAPGATEIYMIQDVAECPSTAPVGVTCLVVYGRYQLLLSPDEDTTAVSTEYTNKTQTAIDNGLLQDSLEATDADNILTVYTSTAMLTPAMATGACSLCASGQDPTLMNKPIGNDGGAIFDCADMVDLYAAQPPEACLNYGFSVSSDMPAPVAVSFQDLPIQFQEYCQCPTSSDNSVSPPTEDVTTCGPFCPANTEVPTNYKSLVADPNSGLTCGSLEVLADSINDLRMCPAMRLYAGACCTSPDNGDNGGEETEKPGSTSPPTVRGTEVTSIESNFLVYNDRGLNAHVMMLGPTRERMSISYAAFVEEVVAIVASSSAGGGSSSPDAPSSNETRYIRSRVLLQQNAKRQQRRRHLEVVYDASSAEVYAFNNTACPTTVPLNATCAIGYGRYNLFLVDEDNVTISQVYTDATQDAIEEGLFAETHESLDPFSWVVIDGTAEGSEPTKYVPPESPGDDDDKGYDEFFLVGIGVSIAIIVVTVVAILCASDLSGNDRDDDSVDPWERDGSRSSSRRSKAKEKAPKKKKFSPYNKDIPPKTERQEYEMYRAQLEKLVEQKCPEEFDNVDDLMDLFYEREPILIATLEKMPDCSEHLEMEEELRNSQHKASGSFNHSNDSMDWQSFADEEGSEEESGDDEEGNHDSFADDDGDTDEDYNEGKEDEAEVDEEDDDSVGDLEAPKDDGDEEDDEDDGDDDHDKGQVRPGSLHAHLTNSASLNFTAHTIVEGENEDESSHATGSTFSAPKAVPAHANGKSKEEDDDSDEEESIPPPPSGMDNSAKSGAEKFDDEDLE